MATALNVYENTIALTLAILSERFLLPEQAWDKLEDPGKQSFSLTDEDKEDILAMREQECTWREIGQIYGIDPTHACRIARKHKEEGKC